MLLLLLLFLLPQHRLYHLEFMPGFASGIVLDRDTSLPWALFINIYSVSFSGVAQFQGRGMYSKLLHIISELLSPVVGHYSPGRKIPMFAHGFNTIF